MHVKQFYIVCSVSRRKCQHSAKVRLSTNFIKKPACIRKKVLLLTARTQTHQFVPLNHPFTDILLSVIRGTFGLGEKAREGQKLRRVKAPGRLGERSQQCMSADEAHMITVFCNYSERQADLSLARHARPICYCTRPTYEVRLIYIVHT